MTDYREILRLGSQNYSQRSIAQAAGCSRNTVEKVLRTASAKGVQWPLENDVSNRDLEELLFPEKYRNASMYTEPDYPYIHQARWLKNSVHVALALRFMHATWYSARAPPPLLAF